MRNDQVVEQLGDLDLVAARQRMVQGKQATRTRSRAPACVLGQVHRRPGSGGGDARLLPSEPESGKAGVPEIEHSMGFDTDVR